MSSYNAQRPTTLVEAVICGSGLVVRLSDVKKMSVKPFDSEQQVLDKLKGEEHKYIYLSTKSDGIQYVDLEDQVNKEFIFGTGYYSTGTKTETVLRIIIDNWLKISNNERE
jgi:hypothetical protein